MGSNNRIKTEFPETCNNLSLDAKYICNAISLVLSWE